MQEWRSAMYGRGIGVLAVVLGMVSQAVLGAGSGDWPGWRGGNRDGKSTETGLLKEWPVGGPKLLWKVTDIGKGYSTVAIVGDAIYTTGDVEGKLVLFALDSKGQHKWKIEQGPGFDTSHPGARSTPVVDGDRLYLVGGQGRVSCHSTADGKEQWSRELKSFGGKPGNWGYSESVLIVDNLAIVTPGGKNAVVALDKTSGKTVWLGEVEARAHYSSAIVIREKDSTIIVQGTGNGLVSVNAADGKKVWSDGFCSGNTANCPDPAYADGHLFWANGYGKGGICFKVESAAGKWSFTELWRTSKMVCHHGGYVIHDGHVYGNHAGGWSCLELKTGGVKWTDQKGVGKGSVCFADGMLYLFGESGGRAGLAAATPDGFKMTGNVKVAGAGPSWAHPVVNGGRLFLRYDTNLYCFDVKAR